MEMAQTKLTALLLCAAALLAVGGCAGRGFEMQWEPIGVDGRLSGVSAVCGPDVTRSLGEVDPSMVYTAPSGKVYGPLSATSAAAKALLDVQPGMTGLKEILSRSRCAMTRYRPESELGNWTADMVLEGVKDAIGPADWSLVNPGGIRVDMPEGEVLMDDIVSMFPFKNYLCRVTLRGRDVRAMFEDMVAHHNYMACSGVTLVVDGDCVESLEIAGERLRDDALYRLATLDFLLDGGDHIYAARNAVRLEQSKRRVGDWAVEYVRRLEAEGTGICPPLMGRVTVKNPASGAAVEQEEDDDDDDGALPERKACCRHIGKPRLVILHVNDTHSHLEPDRCGGNAGRGGLIERAAIVDSVRSALGEDRVLLLHAGDFNQGSSYFSTFGGEVEIKALEALGYDCVTLGNHEFDNGIEDLSRRLSKLQGVPVVCCNLDLSPFELGNYVTPCTVVERGGLRIGIIGVAPSLKSCVSAQTSSRIPQLDAVEQINSCAASLRAERGCELVIALTHIGWREDNEIAGSLHGVDLIIGGHSHTFVDDFAIVEDADLKSVRIVTDGCFGYNIGKISIW